VDKDLEKNIKNKQMRDIKKKYNNELDHLNVTLEKLEMDLQEFTQLTGHGIFSSIKNIANKIKDKVINVKDKVIESFHHIFDKASKYNNISRRTLEKYADSKITNIQIFRTPINSAISKILKSVKYGFDDLFHLALIVTVKHNDMIQNIVVEKNEVINISTSYKKKSNTEVHNIDFNMDITLIEFINKAQQSVTPNIWFEYDGLQNNCQSYLRIILKANDLYTDATEKFVFQDLTELIKETPQFFSKIANIVTDTAGVVSRMTGKGSAKTRLNELLDKLKLINDVLRHGNKNERIKLANNLNVML
jgi:hypothetical protein